MVMVVEESNRNRQLIALLGNEGKPKSDIMADRLREINPDLDLTVICDYMEGDKIIKLLDNQPFDYVVDAIDTLTPKVFLIYNSLKKGYKIASSMGAGGKTDPLKIQVSDISKSYNCRLAKMIRKRLSKLGVKKGCESGFFT